MRDANRSRFSVALKTYNEQVAGRPFSHSANTIRPSLALFAHL